MEEKSKSIIGGIFSSFFILIFSAVTTVLFLGILRGSSNAIQENGLWNIIQAIPMKIISTLKKDAITITNVFGKLIQLLGGK